MTLILAGALLASNVLAVDTSRLDAASTPVSLVAPAPQADPQHMHKAGPRTPDVVAPILACALGTAHECFTASGAPQSGVYVNVASFFDRRGRSREGHYMLKLFVPETPGRYRLTGLGFHGRVPDHELDRFPSAGALVTKAAQPVFPQAQLVQDARERNVVIEPSADMTCVRFSGEPIVLEEGDAAWLIVGFPEMASTRFAGVLVDTDAQDLNCDYMTNDGGRHWYRPSGAGNTKYDWSITAFTEPIASKENVVAGDPKTWSLVKTHYR